MEVKNSTECYIYIFGQETNGSSYVLFPYLKPGETVSKHAPYCGITGYRLFPKPNRLKRIMWATGIILPLLRVKKN
ncbi:DUF4384 domain-containing protein [Niabella defluvii]|nr:DUF4384 domain-containing protein [Niabella sp. I65]